MLDLKGSNTHGPSDGRPQEQQGMNKEEEATKEGGWVGGRERQSVTDLESDE
jgi:hypothetical protein